MRLPSLFSACRRYPLLKLAASKQGYTATSCLKVIAITLVLPLLVCLGSWLDGTVEMQVPARGLINHYGFWAQFITTPIILLLSGLALANFLKAMSSINRYTVSDDVPRDLRRLVVAQIASLCLRSRSKYLLYFSVILGLMWTIVNIVKTVDPVQTYGNPVFDSPDHPFGFLATKLFLLLNWSFVYPVSLFLAAHITWSMVIVLRYMCAHRMLRIEFFNPDNCGGMSIFGSINLIIMAVYFNLFIVIVALDATHSTRYLTLVLASIVASVSFMLQSFGAVFYIHRFVRTKKREHLKLVNEQLDRQMITSVRVGRFSSELLAARNHLLSINSYPYTRQAAALVNTIRFAPAALAIAKAFQLLS